MVDIAVISTMLSEPSRAVQPSIREAENHFAAFTPFEAWLDVTLETTRWSESNTPRADSEPQSTLTTTNRITKATRDTTKLNFITDHGSTRAMVRCACRTERLAAAFDVALRTVAGAWAGAGGGAGCGVATVTVGLAGGGGFTFPADRKKVRAGDDGDVGGGSGVSQVNAAAETAGGSGLGCGAYDSLSAGTGV